MKTEDLQRYERMYREMAERFGTPLLAFDFARSKGNPGVRSQQGGRPRPERVPDGEGGLR